MNSVCWKADRSGWIVHCTAVHKKMFMIRLQRTVVAVQTIALYTYAYDWTWFDISHWPKHKIMPYHLDKELKGKQETAWVRRMRWDGFTIWIHRKYLMSYLRVRVSHLKNSYHIVKLGNRFLASVSNLVFHNCTKGLQNRFNNLSDRIAYEIITHTENTWKLKRSLSLSVSSLFSDILVHTQNGDICKTTAAYVVLSCVQYAMTDKTLAHTRTQVIWNIRTGNVEQMNRM